MRQEILEAKKKERGGLYEEDFHSGVRSVVGGHGSNGYTGFRRGPEAGRS
jgi:hypothetical protein